ncbi:predicted protein [Lichtheimia corymbifera JMRC:FSU:9682]|uniref:Uncharacterized protein n=1 Tax=Lichtheimia corymbifera JMRC:FSU:9682 TaxID=1263082 RepID=A0A068S5M0_9FUNG|nr:predicted protein [Lichtheimia corymbifera JMRC:FSU:9682]
MTPPLNNDVQRLRFVVQEVDNLAICATNHYLLQASHDRLGHHLQVWTMDIWEMLVQSGYGLVGHLDNGILQADDGMTGVVPGNTTVGRKGFGSGVMHTVL